jgi:hypothetical protein
MITKEWKPKDGEDYFIVDPAITSVMDVRWNGSRMDEALYSGGNYFRTEALAVIARTAVVAALKGAEHG